MQVVFRAGPIVVPNFPSYSKDNRRELILQATHHVGTSTSLHVHDDFVPNLSDSGTVIPHRNTVLSCQGYHKRKS